MSSQLSSFNLTPAIAQRLASSLRVSGLYSGGAAAARLRREVSAAARRATRTGSIVSPRMGLRLNVYRATLFGQPYELVTRPAAGDERVVGIVPTRGAPRGSAASSELEAGADQGASVRSSLQRSILSERESAELAFELLGAETEEELDQFLGKVFSKVAKAASGVARTVSNVGKSLGKVLDTVSKVVPIGSVLSLTPLGMTLRAAKSLGRIARGENVFKVAGDFVKSGLQNVGKVAQLASTVAAFVPGLGTGVAAALGAAGALAQGRPITEAVLAAARGALPGGAIAAAAFDVASNLAQGKKLSDAMLSAARNQLPGGPAARAAFDAGLALARGKKLQDVALSTAGRVLPPSPFASTALQFAGRVARGEKVQNAALSTLGQSMLRQVRSPLAIPADRARRRFASSVAFPAVGN